MEYTPYSADFFLLQFGIFLSKFTFTPLDDVNSILDRFLNSMPYVTRVTRLVVMRLEATNYVAVDVALT